MQACDNLRSYSNRRSAVSVPHRCNVAPSHIRPGGQDEAHESPVGLTGMHCTLEAAVPNFDLETKGDRRGHRPSEVAPQTSSSDRGHIQGVFAKGSPSHGGLVSCNVPIEGGRDLSGSHAVGRASSFDLLEINRTGGAGEASELALKAKALSQTSEAPSSSYVGDDFWDTFDGSGLTPSPAEPACSAAMVAPIVSSVFELPEVPKSQRRRGSVMEDTREKRVRLSNTSELYPKICVAKKGNLMRRAGESLVSGSNNSDTYSSVIEKMYTTREEALGIIDSYLSIWFPGVETPRWTCEAQREAVLQMMYYNGDMDLHLPTGFGKSVVYEIPSMTFNKRMASVVVIPFVPLTDQAEASLAALSLGVTRWKARDMKCISEKENVQVVIMSGNAAGNGKTRA